MKLAEKCGDIAAPGIIELLAPLLIILPVGISLIVMYRAENGMGRWEALARVVLVSLSGAVLAALLFKC